MFGPPTKRRNPFYIITSIVLIMVLAVVTGSAALVIASILVVLVVFYPFFFYLWEKIYGLEDIADQVFHAHTDDGWNIAMHFHRPRYPRPGAYPVILCHGIAVNKFGVDMDRGHSLAYFLKQNGYPVFVLSLRGVGKSYHSYKGGYRDFGFDDFVKFDAPAVVARVATDTARRARAPASDPGVRRDRRGDAGPPGCRGRWSAARRGGRAGT